MIMLNEQYQGLTPSYLFAEVARRAAAFAQAGRRRAYVNFFSLCRNGRQNYYNDIYG